MSQSKLYKDLMKEADRRNEIGHPAPAHDLRGMASDVQRAETYLEHSKQIRK